MAIEVALEDDLYFADLNRQISLLIDEDEDDDDDDFPVAHFTSFPAQGYSSRMIQHPPIMASSQYLYQESCRREMCKGTGVFIPQSSQTRRKYNKQGKHSTPQSYAAKSNKKQLACSRGRTTNAAAQIIKPSPTYEIGMIYKY